MADETKESAPPGSTTPEKAASEDHEEWIYTISRSSGEVVKVERVEPASGERRELSLDEYAALSGEEAAEAEVAEDYSSYAYDPYGYEEGYYQGQADYEAALSGEEELSPEEAAYYQGQADYEAALSGEEELSPEEAAYYQGQADYEAALSAGEELSPEEAAYYQGQADYAASFDLA